MTRVVIESPYGRDAAGNRVDAATLARNKRYLAAALLDSIGRGEAPFASHAIYPLALDDADDDHRALGILAGFEWGAVADLRAFYVDLGMTPGMLLGADEAARLRQHVEYRTLPGWSET